MECQSPLVESMNQANHEATACECKWPNSEATNHNLAWREFWKKVRLVVWVDSSVPTIFIHRCSRLFATARSKLAKMPPKKSVSEPKLLLGRPGNNMKMGVVGLPNVGYVLSNTGWWMRQEIHLLQCIDTVCCCSWELSILHHRPRGVARRRPRCPIRLALRNVQAGIKGPCVPHRDWHCWSGEGSQQWRGSGKCVPESYSSGGRNIPRRS